MKDQIVLGVSCLIFILIVAFLLSFECIYALANGQPDCMFAKDVITCVKVGVNK